MLTQEERPVQQAEPEAPAPKGRRAAFHLNRQGRAAHVFLIPWQLGFLLITAVPLFASLYLAFTDYDILNPPEWTGARRAQVDAAVDAAIAGALGAAWT